MPRYLTQTESRVVNKVALRAVKLQPHANLMDVTMSLSRRICNGSIALFELKRASHSELLQLIKG